MNHLNTTNQSYESIANRLTEYRENNMPITLLTSKHINNTIFYTEVDYHSSCQNSISLEPSEPYFADFMVPSDMLHQNDFFEFSMVSRENLHMLIENGSNIHQPGDFFIFNRKTRHMEASPCDAYYLSLTKEFFENWPSEITSLFHKGSKLMSFIGNNMDDDLKNNKDYIDLRFKGTKEDLQKICSIFDQMQEEFTAKQSGCKLIILGLISRLFQILENPAIYSYAHIDLSSDKEIMLVDLIKHHIKKYNGKISLSELSAICHYNTDYMNRIYKKYTGYTINKYCEIYRLHKCCVLLEKTNDSISDIISKMNFTNKTFFYHSFYKQYGMTPQEYRESH